MEHHPTIGLKLHIMPLRLFHESLGVTWHTQGEQEIPWSYGDLEAELEALRYAALLDFSEYGLVGLKGLDRRDFLHNQCTSDIRRMPEGSWLETVFLNAKGQVEHAGLVLHLGESFWISSPSAKALANRFRKYIVFDQVEVNELEAGLPCACKVSGPRKSPGGWALCLLAGA